MSLAVRTIVNHREVKWEVVCHGSHISHECHVLGVVASSLRHEICMNISSIEGRGRELPYIFVLGNFGYGKPARPHDPALEHEKLKQTSVRPKYPSNITNVTRVRTCHIGIWRVFPVYPL